MRILAVHGYEVYPNGVLSELCKSVCMYVEAIHAEYGMILLLAGQHLHGASRTVDQIMKDSLAFNGVPLDKLIAWSDEDVCPTQRPPRTTLEEVDILPHMLCALGFTPKETELDVACIESYQPVVKFLYTHRGANIHRYRFASSHDTNRQLVALVTLAITRFWPLGNGPVFERIKRSRNVFPAQPNGEPWRDNLPSAWEE